MSLESAHPIFPVNDGVADVPSGVVKADEPLLVEQLRRGDVAALERMIAEHREPIRRLVYRLTGWTGDADDLVQDVFVRALEAAGRFRGDSSLRTWLIRIAVNVCRQHHRTRLFRAEFWKKRAQEPLNLPADDASENLERAERIARINQAVRRLKRRYREIIVLHHLEEMEIGQVAIVLGISANAVRVQLHRARAELAKMLESLIEEK